MSSAGTNSDVWRFSRGSKYTFLNALPDNPRPQSIRSCSGLYSVITSKSWWFISSWTRAAASFLPEVSLPIIFVLTGPIDGNVAIIVSAWNLTNASLSSGWCTPHAPSQGSVRSSIFMPSSSKPSVYVVIQSLREATSSSKSDSKSAAIDESSPSSSRSAKFSSNSSSVSPLGSKSISIPPIAICSDSGSSISISMSGSSPPSKDSSPSGAWFRLLSNI